jgi:hypothetical protein
VRKNEICEDDFTIQYTCHMIISAGVLNLNNDVLFSFINITVCHIASSDLQCNRVKTQCVKFSGKKI